MRQCLASSSYVHVMHGALAITRAIGYDATVKHWIMRNCKLPSLPLSCTGYNFYWLDEVNRIRQFIMLFYTIIDCNSCERNVCLLKKKVKHHYKSTCPLCQVEKIKKEGKTSVITTALLCMQPWTYRCCFGYISIRKRMH